MQVDCETYNRMCTGRAVSVKTFRSDAVRKRGSDDSDDDSDDNDDSGYDSDYAEGKKSTPPAPLTEEQCMHATNLVCGFAFSEKEWVEFYVDRLGPVEWNEGAFEHLVLPARQKSLVKALVESHMREATEDGFDDVIKGKGRGLISILHGPPGVGKTLTYVSDNRISRRAHTISWITAPSLSPSS
jgi:hypothetical protein